MSDLIDRQQAIEAICMETCGVSLKNERCMVHCTEVQTVEKLPSAQPERIKGRWISADAIFGGVPFYCSECGENTRDTAMGKPRWNFCPNCGADMEVAE